MLRDESVEVVPTSAQEESTLGYREIDRELRRIAKKCAGLDVEEARWLRMAEQQRIWRKLGFSTALEYLEDVFGYAPRTAMERMRVAKELGELPELEAELREGAMPYSAAKELSRVMTPATAAAWLSRARGKNLRDIEELVAGHKQGDDPDAPKDPALMTRPWTVKLTPRVDAMLQQCRGAAADELGGHIEDVDLIELLCRRFLEGPAPASEKPTPPAHRIVVHKCDECGRAQQEGRGKHVELNADEIALAECDAELSSDGERVKSGISARVRKQVWKRDEGRCRVPGCRATRNLDVHHIVPRALGGDHDLANLLMLCSGHHKLLHGGLLVITGRAPDALRFERDGKSLVDARSAAEQRSGRDLPKRTHVAARHGRFDEVVQFEQVKQGLRQLGFKSRDAKQALEDAIAHVGADADVPTLVRTVLARQHAVHPKDEPDVFSMARRGLVQLGYPATIATAAVEAARAHVGDQATLELVLKEALKRCASL